MSDEQWIAASMSRACPKCGSPGGAEVTHVCMTAGRIDGPVAGNHLCQQPLVFGLTSPQQPDWTCGVCGRMWRDQISGAVRWWAEIRGPNV